MNAGDAPGGLVSALTAWVTANAGWIIVLSAAYFILSLLVIRILIIRMPADFFLVGRRAPSEYRHPAAATFLLVAKNILGILIIVVGLVMSLPGIPGQGFLTTLLGLTLTDFPGKRRIELWILLRPPIRGAINSLRRNAGKPPLLFPDGESEGGGGAAHG